MFEFIVHVSDCGQQRLFGDGASNRAPFREDDGGVVQEGVVGVVVFCDCIEPLARCCGESWRILLLGSVCVRGDRCGPVWMSHRIFSH